MHRCLLHFNLGHSILNKHSILNSEHPLSYALFVVLVYIFSQYQPTRRKVLSGLFTIKIQKRIKPLTDSLLQEP